MSRTSTVPASVPSLFQSSRPVSGRLATKKTLLPTRTKKLDAEYSIDEPAPMLMSLTSTVPSEVPSLFQSSLQTPGLSALKKSVPLLATRSMGTDDPDPGLISLTRTVPAAVPSLFHSSVPVSGRLAAKNKVPFTTASTDGPEEP